MRIYPSSGFSTTLFNKKKGASTVTIIAPDEYRWRLTFSSASFLVPQRFRTFENVLGMRKDRVCDVKTKVNAD